MKNDVKKMMDLLREYDDSSLANSKKELKKALAEIKVIWKSLSNIQNNLQGAFKPGQAGTTLQWDKLYDEVHSQQLQAVKYELEDFEEAVNNALRRIK